jgi:hypothetical protein
MTHALQQETAGRRNYRRHEAAAYIRDKYNVPCTTATLATIFCRGRGPRAFLFGRIPIYPEEGLDEWVEARLGAPVRSTSEARSLAARAGAEGGGIEVDAKSRPSTATQGRAIGVRRRKVRSSAPTETSVATPRRQGGVSATRCEVADSEYAATAK